MRALITGIGGFAGRHLAGLLEAEGLEVWGIDRPKSDPPSPRVLRFDLLDRGMAREALETAGPDLVFHLAAQSAPSLAWKDPEATLRNNLFVQMNLLEALRGLPLHPRVLVVSSGEVYGTPQRLPVMEADPLLPTNPYALSKAVQDLMAYQYYAAFGIPIIRVRPFNHLGPGQSDDFVLPTLARQVAEVEAGKRPPVIQVGNLQARRDFTDVRDIVRAYYLAAVKGEPGNVYNIGSGRAVSIQSLLDFLLQETPTSIKVEQDPARYRPVDIPLAWTDAAKLRRVTGWRPTIPLETTVREVLEYWRARVGQTAPDNPS